MAEPLASSAPSARAPSTGPIPDRSKDLVTVPAAFMISIVVVVALRFWVRVKIVGKIGLDDWLIGAATVLSLLGCSFVIISAQYGVGKHTKDIPPADLPTALKYLFATQPLSVLTLCMAKVSIGAFLYRLAATKTYRYICLGFVAITSMHSFAMCCFMIFQCTPISLSWERTGTSGKCVPAEIGEAIARSYSIIFALSDFFLVLLPIAMLWKARISRRQRCMICGVMGVGTVAATASIVKATYIRKTFANDDFLWNVVNVAIWTAVENNIGIISASMPALKPLITKVVEKTKSSMIGEGPSGASRAHELSALRKEGGIQGGSRGGITTDIRANCNRGAANMRNGSEEGIIGISKTTDVRVDVDTVSNSSGEIPPAHAEMQW